MSKKELISVPKAAQMLGLSIPYTQRLIRSGKIKGQKIEKSCWFAFEDSLRAYKEAREKRRGGRPARQSWIVGL